MVSWYSQPRVLPTGLYCSTGVGSKKLDHSEFDTFKDFYTHGWQKFVEYNIVDVELVDRMEDKLKLIELALTIYNAKVNYQDIFYQVRLWDCIIYNELKRKNIVIPSKSRTSKDEKSMRGHMSRNRFQESMIGWLVLTLIVFTLISSCSTIFRQKHSLMNEHPTATIDRILNEEVDFGMYSDNAICANGAMFRKDIRGFLPDLMQKMYGERVIFKKKMLKLKQEYEKTPTESLKKEIARCDNIQMAKKISLNSAYGAIGNQYFRYYKLENVGFHHPLRTSVNPMD